jgi:3-deoxy-7-phosphoheptulonate synthase
MQKNLNFIRKLPIPMDVKAQYPLKPEYAEKKIQRDKEIADVFTGKDSRMVLVIGPCSADREDSVLDYISRLARVQEKVSDKLIIIPRIYTNKPRTTGDGYKGMVHQPNPDAEADMLEGIIAIRRLHTKAISES